MQEYPYKGTTASRGGSMAMSPDEAVRRAFEIMAEAGRQALESDLGNDPSWTEEEAGAIRGCVEAIIAQMRTTAIRAKPR